MNIISTAIMIYTMIAIISITIITIIDRNRKGQQRVATSAHLLMVLP